MLHEPWQPQMTGPERTRGWIFFLLYLLVFPTLGVFLQIILFADTEAPIAEVNVLYYALIFVLSLAVFWRYLRGGLDRLLDALPVSLFALVSGLVGAGVLHMLVMLPPYPVVSPVSAQWQQEFLLSPGATMLLVVVLIPLIEEPLYRGLVFGSLRLKGRVSAYAVSILVYSLSCVWRYALELGDVRFLLLAVQYIPMSLALAWCYDYSRSIWTTTLLRMVLNGFALLLTLR